MKTLPGQRILLVVGLCLVLFSKVDLPVLLGVPTNMIVDCGFKKLFISLLFIASCSLSAQVKLYKKGGVVLEGASIAYKTGKIALGITVEKCNGTAS